MADCGYSAISHNVSQERQSEHGDNLDYRAVGVVIAVRKEYIGTWEHIEKDEAGRAVAATLLTSTGTTTLIVGVYGPTGACLPDFTGNQSQVRVERSLVEFLQHQARKADDHGWHLVVVGDMNSFTDPALDKWSGPSEARQACVASTLEGLQLRDGFRERHPELRAYTYFSASGSASRLDQTWCRAALGEQLIIANVAIV